VTADPRATIRDGFAWPIRTSPWPRRGAFLRRTAGAAGTAAGFDLLSAKLGKDVAVGAFTAIGEDVVIGDGVVIYPNVTIEPARHRRADDRLSQVSIYYGSRIGRRCILHSGVVIGSDG
jgi:acetyltransferase-like isoleucine patch superfamily enzyme